MDVLIGLMVGIDIGWIIVIIAELAILIVEEIRD